MTPIRKGVEDFEAVLAGFIEREQATWTADEVALFDAETAAQAAAMDEHRATLDRLSATTEDKAALWRARWTEALRGL